MDILIISNALIIVNEFNKKKESYKREAVIAVISSILPALLVIFGYFIKRITWEGAPAEVAILKMPANILQEVIGVAIAIIICYACGLKRRLIKARLLPDFKKEIIADGGKKQDETAEETEQPAE